MSINERMASLETAVRIGFKRSEEDREQVKEALEKHNLEMKNSIASIGLRLDQHDDLINQGKGFHKALSWLWLLMLGLWGVLESYFHWGKGK